jgi:GH25 family lysozyme M1 (1,4-beta-N-acetylmuramidase)
VGAASGGRLTFSLVALAVLMASGATGIVVVGAGPGHSSGGGKTTMTGTTAQHQGAGPGRPTPASAAAAAAKGKKGAAGSAADAAGRYNVGAAHSPTLLRDLAGPLSQTGEVSGTLAQGVDVAADQHPGGAAIEWSRVVAAGYMFAAVKVTEGNYYANPWYAGDAAGAANAGLNVTGYHFAIPNVSGGAAQAAFAVSHLGDTGGQARALAVDLEYDPYTAIDHTGPCYGMSAAQLVSWISAFSNEARRLTGQTPAIDTTAAWWASCTGDSTAFGSAALWVAGYGPGHPAHPEAWRSWTVWQYTSAGTVPGIEASGSVDLSYATGYPAAVANGGGASGGGGSGGTGNAGGGGNGRGGSGQPGPFAPAATHRSVPTPAALASPAGSTPAAEPSAVEPDAVVPVSVSASPSAS